MVSLLEGALILCISWLFVVVAINHKTISPRPPRRPPMSPLFSSCQHDLLHVHQWSAFPMLLGQIDPRLL